jgi:MOSC domain-containing protein YiiM
MTHGRLLGIARRLASRAPMELLTEAAVGLENGVAGDLRGRIEPGRSTRRQVVVMRREDWEAALGELGLDLPWTTRRSNLLVEGVHLPRRAGDHVVIGDLRLEITGECDPCRRMDEQHPGLMAALGPEWRGGVTTRVVAGGTISIGDEVRIEAV